MEHRYLKYAGYKHLSCDRKTRIHKLLNLETKQIEIWEESDLNVGVPFKNTHLIFIKIIGREQG